MSRPLRVTALQRLGKRVDQLDDAVRGHGLRLDGLAQRVQELAQTFAETAHMGNFEAMYRLEREENIRLRQNGHQGIETTLVEGWIAQLESLVQQLRGREEWRSQVRCLERGCYAYQSMVEAPHAHRIDPAKLTRDEEQVVQRFRQELRAGTGHCLRCGQLWASCRCVA